MLGIWMKVQLELEITSPVSCLSHRWASIPQFSKVSSAGLFASTQLPPPMAVVSRGDVLPKECRAFKGN